MFAAVVRQSFKINPVAATVTIFSNPKWMLWVLLGDPELFAEMITVAKLIELLSDD